MAKPKKTPANSKKQVASDAPKKSTKSTQPVGGEADFTISTLPRTALWELDFNSGSIRWSANADQLLQATKSVPVPTTLQELQSRIYPEDSIEFQAALAHALDDGKDLAIEVRMKVGGSSFIWAELAASAPVSISKNKKLTGTFQDVTHRKLTEYELADWKTRHELVSESAGLLIYDFDVKTGEIIWSGNTQQVVGFSATEMERIEQWEQLIHPDDRDEAKRQLELSRKQLSTYDVYYRFRTSRQGYSYMHDRGMFITNADGEAVRMLGIMTDVSERVAAVRTIEQSEKSYRELFNCVGEAIYVQNPDGTFLDVNREACEMYGYAKDELIGKTPEFLSAPGKNDFESLKLQIGEALAGKPQQFVWWGLRKSGDIFLKEVRLTRSTYFGSEVIIASAWDITEKVAAEHSLQESEKRFRHMIEDLNVGVILQGPGGNVQIANRNAVTLLGQSAIAGFGTENHPGTRFTTEEGKPIQSDMLPWNLARENKQSVRGVVVGIAVDETKPRTWLLVNAEPTLLEDEQLLHVLITLTDITERRQIEQSLKESELRFRTLQEASFGGIGLHNKGRILDCNQGLCNLTGYDYDELIGSDGLNLIVPEYREYVMQKILSKDEEPYDVEGLRKDGSRYSLEIKGKNIPFGDGLIRVTEFRDITDRKLVEAKILEQNARLQTVTEDLKLRNEQLREFTQIVSHNLRAPVGNILSLLNFIENAESQEEQQEYVALLKEAGTRTLTTLQELNEVLQIKQDKKIERQLLRFEEVFQHVRNMLNAKIAEAKAEIVTEFSQAPEIIYPNIYLESILLNLLSNALKYTHPERKPVIRLSTEKRGDQILLSVADNGAGINLKRYGEHIFKLRKTFHKHPESRGIGLFMIKNQVEAMGGDITLTSREGEGTTFFITFNQSASS